VRFDAMEANRIPSPADLPPIELILLDTAQLGKRLNNAENGRRWEASALAIRLRDIVEGERRVVYDREKDTLRPIQYGDVALLFQSMTSVGIYEEALKEAELPYVTIAGRGYYDRQEVWDILNLLRALHFTGDELSLAAALRSPMFAFSDDALFSLRSLMTDDGEYLSLWDALMEYGMAAVPLEDVPRVKFARECLLELAALAGRVTIAELIRTALERTGYLAMLTGLPDGARRRGNVEKLLEKARTSGQTSLGRFSQYLADLTERETREGEALLEADDAIKLMTVHKSKGLEFPLVVLVDVSRDLGGDRDSAALINSDIGLACRVYDMDERKFVASFAYRRAALLAKLRDEAERKRLLYVAATRAQDCLIISGQIGFNKDGELSASGWLKWLAQVFNLANIPLQDGIDLEYAWGRARLHMPPPPDASAYSRRDDAPIAWDISPDLAAIPPLIPPPPAERDAPARSMSATQIADLGGSAQAMPNNQRPVYAARWRSSTLHHAPTRIERVSDLTGKHFPRKVGEIVHRILCVTQPDVPPEELQLLAESVAWEQGIVDPEESERAVRESLRLLARVKNSDVTAWIRNGLRVYRELPFVFRTEKRMIHGVMDVLVERAENDWAVIDYKTNWLGTSSPSEAQLAVYARRYTLQVGVYAAAVSELVTTVPRTYIHYIRYNHTVEIKEAEWRSALAKLEHYIGDLMQEDES
jgi:ATP-dependent helicase/nuclease subunit A